MQARILFAAALATLALTSSAGATPVSVQDERLITCGTDQERADALAVAGQLGADRIRINAIEQWQTQPEFANCQPVEAALAVAATGQFRPQITLVGGPRYAAEVARQVGRYVKTYSVWNEPNLSAFHWGQMADGQPATYRRLFVQVSRAIRRNDRGAQVLFGELPPAGIQPVKFMRRALRGARRPVRTEGLAIHPYPHALSYRIAGDPHPRDLARHLRSLQRTLRTLARQRKLCLPGRGCRPVPVWITEFGGTGVPLVKYWRVAQQAGVKQLFHYQLVDAGEWWDTALVGQNGRPRGQFHGLARIARR